MRKFLRGFTIVELLVVISVIGVLATISAISYARFQASARDSQRASQTSVIAEALEKYYDKNGEYPSCHAITQPASTVVSATLPGLDPNVFASPLTSSGTNSITCSCLTQPSGGSPIAAPSACSSPAITALGSTVNTDSYAYVGDGSAVCESTGVSCLQYTLQYRQESTGNIIPVNSRRAASLATSSAITNLAATPYSFNQVNLTWSAVSGATGYTIQTATDSGFTSIVSSATPTSTSTNSASITGLSLGTLYYFRVEPTTGSTTGAWSNTANTTTYTLDTPVGSAADNASTPVSALDFTWNTIQNATSYSVQYAPNTCSGTFTTLTGITGTYPGNITRTISGLTAGTTLCFQVQAIAAGYTSGWSSASSATAQVTPPASYTVSSSTGAALMATSNALCANGATANYIWTANGSPWVSGDQYQSVTYSLGYGQGVTLSVSTRCYIGSAYSTYTDGSNTPSYTRPGLVITQISKVSGGNGHRVWTTWNDLCGSGDNQIIGYQGGYNTGWIAPNWNVSNNPSAGATAMPSATNDVRNWTSGGTVTMYARQNCGGYQQSSNSGVIAA